MSVLLVKAHTSKISRISGGKHSRQKRSFADYWKAETVTTVQSAMRAVSARNGANRSGRTVRTSFERVIAVSDVKWIKITTDIFDDEKILLIESMPDANAIIVVWFKLLCLAGKQNNSGVFLMNDRFPYTDKMLAMIFRMNENTVKLALAAFENYGMIEIVDGVITIPNWGKHQSLERIEARKEYQKEYQREYRKRQKALADVDGKCLREHNVNTAEEDIDKEEDKEKESIYHAVVERLNEKAGTAYRYTTGKTRTCINARVNEGFTQDDFFRVIDKKCADWIGTKYEKYLRPETLFGPKFEGYLNERGDDYDGRNGQASGRSDEIGRAGIWL